MENRRTVNVLLVEDDAGHAKLIKKNLSRAGIHNPIIHLDNGQSAVDFLFRKGEWEGQPLPKPLLVLLDLNLPVLDGLQVLKRMKESEGLKKIPVVVLTTSGEADQVQLCYELGCNVFVKKPVEYDEFCEAIKKLGMFLEIIIMPDEIE